MVTRFPSVVNKVSKINCGDNCTTVNILRGIKLYTAKEVTFIVCELYLWPSESITSSLAPAEPQWLLLNQLERRQQAPRGGRSCARPTEPHPWKQLHVPDIIWVSLGPYHQSLWDPCPAPPEPPGTSPGSRGLGCPSDGAMGSLLQGGLHFTSLSSGGALGG